RYEPCGSGIGIATPIARTPDPAPAPPSAPSAPRRSPGASGAPAAAPPFAEGAPPGLPSAASPGAVRSVTTSHESHPFADGLHRPLGDPGRAFRAVGEEPVEMRLVVQQLERALPDRRERVDDDLGEVLLELAVAAALVAALQVGDGGALKRGVDPQQVRDAGLLLLVVHDLGAGV